VLFFVLLVHLSVLKLFLSQVLEVQFFDGFELVQVLLGFFLNLIPQPLNIRVFLPHQLPSLLKFLLRQRELLIP
jgi:hypothetical protein